MDGTYLLLIILLLLILLIVIKETNYSEKRKLLNKIPGPPTYPIIGNLPQIIGSAEHVWKYFRNAGAKYYPIYRMWNLHIGSVAVLSPPDIELVLTSKKHLRKTKVYEWLQPWLGTGLLTSAGGKWHSRRKILTPAFHFNILQEFTVVFQEQTELMVQKLKNECNKPYTNIIPIITQFTLHSICETAMGTRLNEVDEKTKQYTSAIYRMGEVILYRITRPWLFFNSLYFFTSEYRAQTTAVKILHSFSNAVIAKRQINFTKPKLANEEKPYPFSSKQRLAMLDLLISAKREGAFIDDEGIREEVDTFMFEGHDTTTAAICFTLMLLANNADIQKKAADEVVEVLGDSNEFAFQDIQKLKYLEQVIKEALRLYPSVPLIARVTDENIETTTGYTIPANTYVHIHIYDLHNNPNIYPEPDKFDPERFSPENTQDRHPFAYLPFSAGPRNCIGKRYALLELKIAISMILKNFILQPIDKPSDITLITHLVLKTKNGIKIKFLKR